MRNSDGRNPSSCTMSSMSATERISRGSATAPRRNSERRVWYVAKNSFSSPTSSAKVGVRVPMTLLVCRSTVLDGREGPGAKRSRPGPDRLRDVPDQFGVDLVGLRLHEHDLHAIHPPPGSGEDVYHRAPLGRR